jgi:hypothetical protein
MNEVRVIPAKAGTQAQWQIAALRLISRIRGNDER